MDQSCTILFTCSPECPIEPAHARLREAHHHWHAALENYQEPELFRISLNSCIQSMRNSTFALQKCGGRVPEFDDWYKAEQDDMRSDRTLRWLVESRNQIVKEEDLTIESRAVAWAATSYNAILDVTRRSFLTELGDGDARREVGGSYFNPLADPKKIGKELARRGRIPLSTLSRGVFTIERTWVDSKLPGQELLGALAHCFGHLSGLLERAHSVFGVQRFLVNLSKLDLASSHLSDPGFLEDADHTDLTKLKGPQDPPCMAVTGSQRSESFNLLTGEPLRRKTSFNAPRSAELEKLAQERYGPAPAITLTASPTVQEHVALFSEMGKRIILTGDDHATMLMLYREESLILHEVVLIPSPADKIRVSRDILEKVIRHAATRVVFMAETWISPMDSTIDGTFIPPALHSARREALSVGIHDADGTSSGRLIHFNSWGDPPTRHVEITSEEMVEDVVGLIEPAVSAMRRGHLPKADGSSFWKNPPGARR